jgi:hypothetical protein
MILQKQLILISLIKKYILKGKDWKNKIDIEYNSDSLISTIYINKWIFGKFGNKVAKYKFNYITKNKIESISYTSTEDKIEDKTIKIELDHNYKLTSVYEIIGESRNKFDLIFDKYSNLTKVYKYNDYDNFQEKKMYSYLYNTDSQLTKIIDKNRQTIFEYNNNLIIKETEIDGDIERTTKFTYDTHKRIKSLSIEKIKLKLIYSEKDILIKKFINNTLMEESRVGLFLKINTQKNYIYDNNQTLKFYLQSSLKEEKININIFSIKKTKEVLEGKLISSTSQKIKEGTINQLIYNSNNKLLYQRILEIKSWELIKEIILNDRNIKINKSEIKENWILILLDSNYSFGI